VTSGIETGSNKLTEGIVAGSKALSNGATRGGEYLKSKLTPTEQPVHVNPKIAGTIYIAGKLSPICVTISKVLINTLAKLAEEIGVAVADSLTGTEIEAKMKKNHTKRGSSKRGSKRTWKSYDKSCFKCLGCSRKCRKNHLQKYKCCDGKRG